MGKKKDRRRAKEAGSALEIPAPVIPFPMRTFSDDPDNPVSIGMQLTEADRLRLRTMAIEEGISLQRMGHRAWNAFLASHGLPGLTPVLQGKPRQGEAEG